MTQEKKQEFTLKISQANKTQLITILYEMIIEYLNETLSPVALSFTVNGTFKFADSSLSS